MHVTMTNGMGARVRADPAGGLGLSATGHAVVAGLLAHADALSAVCAPTVNSYKRLAVSQSASGTTWSPVWKAVGSNNRSALVRAVAGRTEWRLPDPACNIYGCPCYTSDAADDLTRGELGSRVTVYYQIP